MKNKVFNITNRASNKAKQVFFALLFGGMFMTVAQTPGIPYQAYIIDTNSGYIPGEQIEVPLANASILLRFEIRDDKGEVEYVEEISARTDEFGMVSTVIGVGNGTPIMDTFDDINWNGKQKLLFTDIDMTGTGADFVDHDSMEIVYIPGPGGGGGVETITTLAYNGDGSYTYTNEDGATTTFSVPQHDSGDPNALGTAGNAGNLYVDESTGDLYIHGGSSWVSLTLGGLLTGTGEPTDTDPANPAGGDIYVDESTGEIYTYNSTTNMWEKQSVVSEDDDNIIVEGSDGLAYLSAAELGIYTGVDAPTASNPTDTPEAGDVYVDETTGDIYTYINTEWIRQAEVNNVTEAATVPTAPVEGDVWFDTTTNISKVYDADTTSWITIDPDSVTVDATAPTTPAEGDIWFDTTENLTKVWDGTSTWEPVKASTALSLWDNDLDTGIQVEESADDDHIRFDTRSVQRMVIDSLGNVGIGVSLPVERLDVVGSVRVRWGDVSVEEPNPSLTLKSTSGSGTVQQWLNFETHSDYRGGGMRWKLTSDPDRVAFFGQPYRRAYLTYAYTATGESTVNHNDPSVKFKIRNLDGFTSIAGNHNPAKALDVGGEARIRTLPLGAATDSIVTANVDGDLRKQSISDMAAAGEPWFTEGTTTGHTLNTGNMFFSGNLAVGTNTFSAGKVATFAGDVDVDGEARIRTLPLGALTDSIVTANADGDLRKQSISDIAAASEPWFGTDDDAGATENTEDIYHLGSKVGIGTTDPGANFDVSSSGETTVLIHSGTEADDAKLEFLHSPDQDPAGMNYAIKNAIVSDGIGNWKRANMRFVLNGAADNSDYDVVADTRMMIGYDGNVGIGRSNPNHRLDIYEGASTNAYDFSVVNRASGDANNYNNLATMVVSNKNNGLFFLVSGQSNQRIVGIQSGHENQSFAGNTGTLTLNPVGGNVGIGISTPAVRLDVNGQARIRTLPLGAATDSIVTANVDGDLRKQSISDVVASVSATSFRTVTTNTTLTSTDGTVVVRAVATTAITITLPLASDLPQGGYLTIKRLDDTATPTAVNIVAGNATDTIDANTNAAYTTQLATNAAKMTLQSDGVSAWYIISE